MDENEGLENEELENEQNSDQESANDTSQNMISQRVKRNASAATKGATNAAKRTLTEGMKKAVVAFLTNPYVLLVLVMIILSAVAYFIIKDLFSKGATDSATETIEEIANDEDADEQTKSLEDTYEVNRSFLTATIKDINKIYDAYIKKLEKEDIINASKDMQTEFGDDEVELEEMNFESDPEEYSKPVEERASTKKIEEKKKEKENEEKDKSDSKTSEPAKTTATGDVNEFLKVAEEKWKYIYNNNYSYSFSAGPPYTNHIMDCSAYVSWVLKEYGCDVGRQNTEGLKNYDWDEFGFETIDVSAGENVIDKLQPGDILVRSDGGGGSGHVNITVSVEDGVVYSYDCGSESNWRNSGGQPYNATSFASGSGGGSSSRAGKIIRIGSVSSKSGNRSSSTSSKINSSASTDKYPSDAVFVLPSQKRELYKHMLMTEKYNFNMIKWKLYKAEGEGPNRVLPADPSDDIEYTVEPSLGLRFPKSEDKTADYFIQLVEPYLQSSLFPISMYSMSVDSDGNKEKEGIARNAQFAYAKISEAYSDVTMNIYKLEDYTENWSHEVWDVGNGALEGKVQCLRVPNNLYSLCKQQTSASVGEVQNLYCSENDCTNWDNMVKSGFLNSSEYNSYADRVKGSKCVEYSTDRLVTRVSSDKKQANTELKGIAAQFGSSNVTYEYRYCIVEDGYEPNKDNETITLTNQESPDVLVSTDKEVSYQYKPYRVKAFDIVLEYEYEFEIYNTNEQPDSISTGTTNLPDERISENVKRTSSSYESEALVKDCHDDGNICDGEFEAVVGTYSDKVNRRRVDTTKNWHDKLNAEPDGFKHRKYNFDDVVEFVFGPSSSTDGDVIVDIEKCDKSLVVTDKDTLKKAFKSYAGNQKLLENLDVFMEMQEKYKVNALFAAAASIAETSGGRAGHAIDGYNNWFNIRGADGNWKNYKDAKESIMGFGNLIANKDENDGHDYFKDNRRSVKQIGPIFCDEKWSESVLTYMTDLYKAIGIDLSTYTVSTSILDDSDSTSTSELESGLSDFAKNYYQDLADNEKLNRIDFINAVPEIYNAYISKLQAVDTHVAIRQKSLESTYAVLIKRFREIEVDGVLPYIYGQTLGLNLNYVFDDDKNGNCSTDSTGTSNYGGYIWPLPSNEYVSSLFGYTAIYGGNHEGIDIWSTKEGGVHKNVDVVAAKDGTVYLAEDKKIPSNGEPGSGGYGNHIIIKHDDGKYTLYGHLETGTLKVKKGEVVKAGQVIAKTGSSGNSTAWHLHFNISGGPYSEYEDPLLYYNVEPTSSKYPEYSKIKKDNVSEYNAYKYVSVKNTSGGADSLDKFLFIGDSRTEGISNELSGVGKDVTVKGISSSKQSEWISVVKNGSGTVQGRRVTLPDAKDIKGISVALGVNEISATGKMDELLDELVKKYPGKKIYVNSVFPVASTYTYMNASTLNSQIKTFNKHIKTKCKENDNLVYVDISNGLTDSSGYLKSEYADSAGLHLSSSKAKEKLVNNIKDGILSGGNSGSDSSSGTKTNQYSVAKDMKKLSNVGSQTNTERFKKFKDKYWNSIVKWAEAYEVDPYLVVAILAHESGCGELADENYVDYRSEYSDGSIVYGIIQLTIHTWQRNELYHEETVFVKDKNGDCVGKFDIEKEMLGNVDMQMRIACSILKCNYQKQDNKTLPAILAYNKGPNNKYSEAYAISVAYTSKVAAYYDIKNSGSYSGGGAYDCISSDDESGENITLSGSYVGEGKEEGNDSKNKGYFTNAGGIKYHTYNQSAYGSMWTNHGCGPTSCAIILSGLTGKEREPTEIFPNLTGNTSFEKELIPLLNKYNIKTEQYYSGKAKSGNYNGNNLNDKDKKFILKQLAKGYPIIIFMKAGGSYNGCTYNGHFMTLLGVKENGDVYVGDPGGWGRDGWIGLDKLIKEASVSVYLVCKP